MSYFVEDLLESIKNRSMAPIAQSTFDDEKLLALADEELQLKLVSNLIQVREDFFLTEEFQDLIASVKNYGIPSRAIGNALKQVFYRADGSEQDIPLVRVDVERIQDFDEGSTGKQPQKFYFLGDEIVLLPKPSESSGELKFVFPANPNTLTLTSNCAKITSKSSASTTATFMVDTDLTSSLSVGDYVDFLSVQSPFKLWAYRVPITQITSSQIDVALSNVVNAANTIEPQADDYICPSGTSNIPQIPLAFHPVLAQSVVVRLMEALGDLNKMNAAKATLAEMELKASNLIKNRVENSLKRIVQRNQLGKFFR